MNPEEADLFVIPIETYVSAALTRPCGGPGQPPALHEERVQAIFNELVHSPYFRRAGGADHLVICAWWGAAKSWGKWDQPNQAKPNLWRLLRPRTVLATIDEYFARDWNKVLVVPYVPHALLTRWRDRPLDTDGAGNVSGSANRDITFFFRGGLLHGVDCKKKARRSSELRGSKEGS